VDNFLQEFKKRVSQKKIKIAVVGLGYVGLPLAIAFAKEGFSVLGIDVDKNRIARIKRKESYITDVSSKELKDVILRKKLLAEDNFRSLNTVDAVLICVPTPLKKKYYPDISFIKNAISAIAKKIKKKTLIILESTTYPGTTEEVILPLLKSRGLKHGEDFYLCFSPERIDPGNARYHLEKIPKVIGGINKEATYLGTLTYKIILDKVIPVSSSRVAETVKLLENTFRLINIGLIDEMAIMANKMNINIWEVIEAAKTKPFGFMPFYPSPGVGGHCIPKDPLYLYWKAKKFGFKSRFIKLASDIITSMPKYVVDRIEQVLNKQGINLNKAKVLIVGITYKKNIKDLRKSPALDIIEILKKNRTYVSYYDPLIPYLKLSNISLKSIDLKKVKLSTFDCVVIVTDHSFLDYRYILNNSKLIFDTRNVYKNITNNKIFRL
jgi:UDP-N-acetyl-D-glucosamine dehydrogenase